MSEHPTKLTARGDQALIGIPVRENGKEMVRYIADEDDLENGASISSVERALALAGVWSDLDADEMLDELDRIRHESKPTPPIDDL